MKTILGILLIFTSLFSYQLTTLGPRGETPIPSNFIYLRADEEKKVIDDSLTLAIALHDTASEFSKRVIHAISRQAEELNISILFTESAQFSSEKQLQQYKQLLTLKPDLLVTLPLSPTETSITLKELAKQGSSISFLSNLPNSLIHPNHYASVVTDDLFEMGRAMANVIAKRSGSNCRLLYIYHDAEYYVTNQRDQSLSHVLQLAYPHIKIIDSLPISQPSEVKEKVDTTLRNGKDKYDAIYTPWATLADSIIPILKEHSSKIDLYTIDKSFPTCYSLIQEKSVKGIITDDPIELGRALLVSAILHHYQHPTPPFAIVPVHTISVENSDEECSDLMIKGGE